MERNVALKNTLLTHRFPFRAEEGVTLQSLVVLALHDVRKHFVVHLVRSAIRYSSGKRGGRKTRLVWGKKTLQL